MMRIEESLMRCKTQPGLFLITYVITFLLEVKLINIK